ncbi:hypothetical protein [Clostridium sp.]|jgi:hypothetical protein|uniref:hypothetical protein n=1 Tax=Clostridium sp. TaxID=1506 RepID=UPI003A48B6C3
MTDFWYRQPIQSKEFKEGLKRERLFRLYMLLASLIKEEGEGQKVRARINAVRKEIGRRKGS